MINTSMWAKALKTIPRITKEEWLDLDVISKWLISTRSAVLIMTAISGLLGGLFAYIYGSFSWIRFVVAVVALIFAHAANNLINDYIDFRKGVDKGNYYRSLYGPQPLEHGYMTVREHMTYFLITLGIALLGGFFLYLKTDATTLLLIGAGMFFLLFYTWPLKYIALGEPTVVVVWGPLMIGGTFYVVSGGVWDWNVAIIALAYAIGPTSVLFGKHTDKLPQDKAKRVYTLPVLLGEKAARITTLAAWIIQYVLVVWFVINGTLGWPLLLIFLAIPKLVWAWKVFAKPRPVEAPSDLPPNTWPLYLSAHAFGYNKRFSLLFLAGLILDVVLLKLNLL
jgi:1,4-dihydroxy-2-naphthoate polyprenyltransferase